MCMGSIINYFGPTHARGGILDLLMTDIPDLIRVAVVAPNEEEVRGERAEETNASTLVRVTSHVTISSKIHCEQTQM